MQDSKTTVGDLKKAFHAFVQARDWELFQTPRNVSLKLFSEAGELLDFFTWIEPDDSVETFKQFIQKTHPKSPPMERVKQELADVATVTIYLAHQLEIDLSKVTCMKSGTARDTECRERQGQTFSDDL